MNKLNNKSFDYYGFKLIEYKGLLDMPSRLGNIFYDWGDWQEPLVHSEDIFWKAKEIQVDLIFDKRNSNKTLNDVLKELANLEVFPLENDYGIYNVSLKEVINTLETRDVIKLTMNLYERLPLFNAILGIGTGGNGLLIDNFNLENDFGIKVIGTKPIDYLPQLKSSSITVNNKSVYLTNHRNFKIFEFDCIIKFENINQLYERTEKFKKLLSLDNYRVITFQNKTYNCFVSEGFKINLIGKQLAKFKLRINITDNFFESGFVNSQFVN